MRKIFLMITLLVLGALALGGCGDSKKAEPGKLQVVASFYPMAEFARQVGGDKVQVTALIADGVEPHDWEPTAKDLGRISKAGLFIYNGGVEPWAPKAIAALDTHQTKVLEAGKGLMTINGQEDPHTWVSPKTAMKEVIAIRDALIKVDVKNTATYKANSDRYLAELAALDKGLTQLSREAKRKEFVTTHAAFGHLAKDYQLVQIPIMGLSPEAEPAPADLTRLVKLIGDRQLKYVFFETLVSPKVAQTIAATAKVETLVLDPVEGLTKEDKAKGLDYVSVMQQNIRNLTKAVKD